MFNGTFWRERGSFHLTFLDGGAFLNLGLGGLSNI